MGGPSPLWDLKGPLFCTQNNTRALRTETSPLGSPVIDLRYLFHEIWMPLRVLTTDKSVVKNFFEISKKFKVVPRPIFRADSKSGLHFVIQLKLTSQFQ